MSVYEINIELWPFFSVPQKECGARHIQFTVHAEDIFEAVQHARLIQTAIKVNPAVWQAPIKSVIHASTSEATSGHGEINERREK